MKAKEVKVEAEEAEVVENRPTKLTIIKTETRVKGTTAKQKIGWINSQISSLNKGIESRRRKIKNLTEQKKLYEKIANLEEGAKVK